MKDQIHEKHLAWIEARGISTELAVRLGLETTRNGAGFWLSVPYVERGQVVNHKYRQTTEKKHRMDHGAPLCLWNHDVLLTEEVQSGRQPVIITEGEWDAMAVMTAGNRYVLSVPNGTAAPGEDAITNPETPGYQYLWRSRDLLDMVGEFIIAADADESGRRLAADLVRWIGPERCRIVSYPEGCKDLNEVLIAHGEGGLNAVINGAKPYPVKGIYQLADYPLPPQHEGYSFGIAALDKHIRILPGTFTVVTGWAGIGKTSLIVHTVARLLRSGVNVCMASFETLPRPILEQKLRGAIAGTAEFSIPAPVQQEADALIAKRFSLIAQSLDDDDELTLDYLLERCRIAVLRDNARVIIVDPWNELEHQRRKDETETEYTGRAIRALKRFARRYEVALWLVAHPKKPDNGNSGPPGLYDINGSSNFANKADYGLVIHRKKNIAKDHPERNVIQAHVTKVRMGLPGEEGMVKLNYDWRTSTYHEWVDEIGDRASAF